MTRKAFVAVPSLSADPTTGGVAAGSLYRNTTSGKLRMYSGSAWGDVASGGTITAADVGPGTYPTGTYNYPASSHIVMANADTIQFTMTSGNTGYIEGVGTTLFLRGGTSGTAIRNNADSATVANLSDTGAFATFGSTNGVAVTDRADSSKVWTMYSSTDVLRWYSSTGGGDRMQLGTNGKLTLVGAGSELDLLGQDDNSKVWAHYVNSDRWRLYSVTAGSDRLQIYNTGQMQFYSTALFLPGTPNAYSGRDYLQAQPTKMVYWETSRFNTPTTVEVASSISSPSWTTVGAPTAAQIADLMIGRTDTAAVNLTTALPALRITLSNSNFAWAYMDQLMLGFSYTGFVPTMRVVVETSSNGTTWTQRVDTGSGWSVETYWWQIPLADHGGDYYFRISIYATLAAAQYTPLKYIGLYSRRVGEGTGGVYGGPNMEMPFSWDRNRNIVLSGELTAQGHVYATGSGSGYSALSVGDGTHTGYIEFRRSGGNREGYIGWASTNVGSDGGTLNYVAGTHSFAGQVYAANGVQLGTGSQSGAGIHSDGSSVYVESGSTAAFVYLRPNGVGSNVGLASFGTTLVTFSATTLNVNAANAALKLDGTGNSSIEIGRTDGTSSTPFIDYHSGATATDYDARLIASGGNGSAGNGTLTADMAVFNVANGAGTSQLQERGVRVYGPNNANLSGTAGGALTFGGTGAAGSGTAYARSDHTHTVPTAYYMQVQDAGVAATQRNAINFIDGTNVTISVADDSANNRTNVTINASGGGGTPATSVTSETVFGISSSVGVSTNYARQDHTHGSPSLGTTSTTAAAGNHTHTLTAADIGAGTFPAGTFTFSGGNTHIVQGGMQFTSAGTQTAYGAYSTGVSFTMGTQGTAATATNLVITPAVWRQIGTYWTGVASSTFETSIKSTVTTSGGVTKMLLTASAVETSGTFNSVGNLFENAVRVWSASNPNLASTVASSTAFGQASAVGTGTAYARNDHVHGTPSTPVTSAVAGTGIGVSGATGAVTFTNTGALLTANTFTGLQTFDAGASIPAGDPLYIGAADAAHDIAGAWTSYTTSWTAATTNPALGNGTKESYYKLIGKTCFVRIHLTMGSTTTYGTGNWTFTLPFAVASVSQAQIGGYGWDSSASNGYDHCRISFSGGSANISIANANPPGSSRGTANGVWDGTTPFAWASGDQLHLQFVCEIA